MSCFYILEIKPLSVALFANIFSHSIECLFVLFMISLAVQKLISLSRYHLFIFAFIFLPWETDLRNIATVYVRIFCLCFLLGVLWCHVLYSGL